MISYEDYKIPYGENKKVASHIRKNLITSLISVLALSLGAAIAVHVSTLGLREEIDQLEFTTSNWRRKPVVDIYVAHSESCPTDYEDIIAEGDWQGIETGCDCTKSLEKSYFGSSINFGACSPNQTTLGCVTIWEIPPTPYRTFKERQICARRLNQEFIELPLPDSQGGCPTGYKVCGSDNKTSQVCVKAEDKCPIYDFYAAPADDDVPKNYKTYRYTNEKTFFYTRGEGATEFPTADFTITEGQPCIDSNEFPASQDRYTYPLERKFQCYEEIDNKNIDTRYHVVDRINQYDLYEENEIIDLLNKLSGYDTKQLQKYEEQLYRRPFISWNHECESKEGLSRQNLISYTENMEWFELWIMILKYICLSNAIIVGAFLGLLTLFSLHRLKDEANEIGAVDLTINAARRKGLYGFAIAQCVFCGFYLSSIAHNQPGFWLMSDADCSDNYTNAVMDSISSWLLGSKIGGFIALGASLALIIIDRAIIFTTVKYARAELANAPKKTEKAKEAQKSEETRKSEETTVEQTEATEVDQPVNPDDKQKVD